MTTVNQLPAEFKTLQGFRFSLLYYHAFAAQGINTMAYAHQIHKGWRLENLTLNYDDVLLLEEYFKIIGITGEYRPTKSGTWVRCSNNLTVDQLIGLRNFLKGK